PTLTAATPGFHSTKLNFTAPASTGSSAIVLYTATCNDGTRSLVGSGTGSPITVAGLTEGVRYQCAVRATNSTAESPDSTALAVTLAATNATPPAPPTGLTVTAGNGSLTLRFTAPAADGGAPIVGFQANCGGFTGSAVASPIVIGGLPNGIPRTCTVSAVNDQGASLGSVAVTATPTVGAGGPVPPGIPTSVTGTAGDAVVSIAFTSPNSDGGSPITSYVVQCNGGGQAFTTTGLTSPVRLAGLQNSTAYNCTVEARNAFGGSTAVAAGTLTPAAGLGKFASALGSANIATTLQALAADGVTGVVITLRGNDGTLYRGDDVTVNLSSTCSARGQATLDASVTAHEGQAVATYEPTGCVGPDTITATVSGASLSAQTRVVVSARALLSAKASLGKRLFFDTGMSATGNQSCASCHAPAHLYLAPNRNATQKGGLTGQVAGLRSSPSVAYTGHLPDFQLVTNAAGVQVPRGGFMWDGRSADLKAQVLPPMLGALEMANVTSAAVLLKLLTRPYLATFRTVFGDTTATTNADTVLANIADAIAQYEKEDPSFAAFNSKYDAVQAGLANFTAQEARGQLLFLAPAHGNCVNCHSPRNGAGTARTAPLFTDSGYHALGVPRQWALAYNDDSAVQALFAALGLGNLLNGSVLGAPNHLFFDLGACGPVRTLTTPDPARCGQFRTPALRNVAAKAAYFHNGVFTDLNRVVDFYANRDTATARFFLTLGGATDVALNDLPTQFQTNLFRGAPFGPAPGNGAVPRFSPADVQDLVAFLCTLTDGFDPTRPEASRLPTQCDAAVRR
ncbi:MAG: Methylamine utilization protein MauG precursor, partial [Pseudomonadota bacterium]